MPYRINHIHLKSPDPRKTAEWYVTAFGFKIVSDETRVFGDRFVRCTSEDGFAVNISGARTNERLGAGDANPHHGLEHFGFDSQDIEADITRLRGWARHCSRGPRRCRRARASRSCAARTTRASSWWSAGRPRAAAASRARAS